MREALILEVTSNWETVLFAVTCGVLTAEGGKPNLKAGYALLRWPGLRCRAGGRSRALAEGAVPILNLLPFGGVPK